ncbi:MAG: selenocysteine-specific translation elongation factor [Oscillospiraceae bacterium]|nr:selenocysteine-specific translation elongation factor [Oscillospiraceae bacterium]
MHNVVIGTAGHVDHGKTCLVKALTGVDTDRLTEEKKRGITIELGFAELPNNRNLKIGVIDVPGHERFIKNMLAGIGGIDLVLLVIAADEGVMPQTVEHFEIIKSLKISRGLIALTKVDIVEDDWLKIVEDDIKEYVSGSFLEGAPVIEVSALTGHNIQQLKEAIIDIAEEVVGRRLEPELFRVPIDRVFSIDGFGTVVTGTLLEGTVSVGDEVEIYPNGYKAKIRKLQVHGSMVDRAYSGQRTALNLMGVRKEDLRRGHVLAASGAMKPTGLIDVKIEMFKTSPRVLLSGSRVHLYFGSAEVLSKVTLLDADRLESGQSGYAQLRLEEKIAIKKNDRFILRFFSPLESLGGGIVLNSNPAKKRRFQDDVLLSLYIRENGNVEEIVEQILFEESMRLPNLPEVGWLAGLTNSEISEVVGVLGKNDKVVYLTEKIAVHKNYWSNAQDKAKSILSQFHNNNPFRSGMPKEEFRNRVGEKLFIKQSKHVEMLTGRMIADGVVVDSGNIISLPGYSITYSPQIKLLKERIENEYLSRGVETPEVEEFMRLFPESERSVVADISDILYREGQLKKLANNCFIHKSCLESAIELLKSYINDKGEITLSEYRDLLGTSRKYAIRILEYLDQQKITRLEAGARVLTGL